jgi:hypothetical protein
LWERARVRGGAERLSDRVLDGGSEGEHVAIREPQYAEVLAAKPLVSPRMARGRAVVLASVQFDDEPRMQTNEIRDVAANRFLSSELVLVESLAAQRAPKTAFGIGRVPAHGSG